MICNYCQKDFHHCSSCGLIPEAEEGYCSERCLFSDLSRMEKESQVKILATMAYRENSLIHANEVKEVLSANFNEVATALLNGIISDSF